MRARGLACIGAGILLGVLGCESTPKRELDLLRAGEEAYRAREYQRAAARLSEFLAANGTGPDATRALYLRGMCRALTNERALAYVDLQAASERAGDDELGWRAAAALGVIYFEDENWAAAVGYLSKALKTMPADAARDAYLFRLGLSLERLGRWQDAQGAFGEIARNHRHGPFGERAARRLRQRPTQFAVQAGVFSRRENAEAQVQALGRYGHRARVTREWREGGEVHVVLVGDYSTYKEAIFALAHVRGVVADATLWP